MKMKLFVVTLSTIVCGGSWAQDPLVVHDNQDGKRIYAEKCASCHGDRGEGVHGKFDNPFSGSWSVNELAALIDQTMPEPDPDLCVDAEAAAVARYIQETFLTAEVAASPRIELVHLTVPQYENAIADIAEFFLPQKTPSPDRGLQANYYESKDTPKDKLIETRVDPNVHVDLVKSDLFKDRKGEEGFHARWEGAVFAPEAGNYQFSVNTPNGFRLYVNDLSEPLIDQWVATPDQNETSESIKLLGGRWYSIKLESFKFKEAQFSIQLSWKRPRRQLTTIATEFLSPSFVPPVFIVGAVFPPDDSSVGYPRGTLVSKEWNAATTEGALEIAEKIATNLRHFAGSRDGANIDEKSRSLCCKFAELAFRQSLNDEQQRRYVDQFFIAGQPVTTSVQKSLIVIFKSPRFLYQDVALDRRPSEVVAERLAWYLWDSIPDQELRTAVAENGLTSKTDVTRVAERMIDAPATRTKIREFVVRWLHLEASADLSKDPAVFAQFDRMLLDDLQESALRFVDDCIWGEGDYRQLYLADYLWLNSRLREFYGVPLTEGTSEEFGKVVVDSNQRAGLLTHPLLLSQLAYYRTTSPIHRGVFVSRNLLGIKLNPPPVAVEPLSEEFDLAMTTRERVEFQTRSENCMSCHRVINPLGFALEGLDAVGRVRELERDRPVDTQVVLETKAGTFKLNGPRQLAEFLADSPDAQRHFVETMFHHLVKQPVAAYGSDKLNELTQRFTESGCRIRELIVDIAVTASMHGLE